jgi:hypothetical protein
MRPMPNGGSRGVVATLGTGLKPPYYARDGSKPMTSLLRCCAVALALPLGALKVGMAVGGEHWHRAELPAQLSIGPDGSGGVRLGLALQF